MKSYWKRTNRGVWLGAVLLVFLIGFIVFKQVRFTLEKPKIRDTARTFVTELMEVNVLPDAEPGELLTDAQKQAQKDALETLLTDYWMKSESEGTVGVATLLRYDELLSDSDLTQRLESNQKDPHNRVTEIDLQIDDRNLSISAEGTDWATVDCQYANMTVKMTGYESYLESVFPTQSYSGYDFYMGDAPSEGEMESEPESCKDWEVGFSLSFSLQMARSGGIWRVTGMSVSLYQTWSNPVEGGNAS